jgi:A/G-specific adenine glycosylase
MIGRAVALSEGELVAAVRDWYAAHGRDLPWRRTRDPYAILVSEVMLQQTQVERVVPRYLAWLERWPTAEALAAAPLADVIAAWSGLGYNRRAVSLHRAAVAVAHDGWPRDVDGLRRLPGVGPYTASALAVQAFGADALPVDVNVRRVLERALGQTSLDPPPGSAWALTQALFDLGATVCIARRPRCEACPLADGCPSRGTTYAPLRRQGPFQGSRRQARGALLRRLAEGPVAVAEIADAGIAEELARDGLAAIRGGLVSLP